MASVFPDNRQERFLEKPLPSSEESERVILGAVLLDNTVFAQLAERLTSDDFYSPLNRRVFVAITALFAAGKRIDPILIGEELKKEGSLESIGGITTITNLTFGLPHFSSVEEYIGVIKDKARVRNLIRTCNKITSDALAEEQDANEVLDAAEQQIFEACARVEQTRPETIAGLGQKSLDRTKSLMDSGVEIIGLPSGLKDIDEMTGGYMKGELTILAARPSMGKSAAAAQFALNIASQERVVAFFSLEMNKDRLVSRMICSESRQNLHSYLNGHLIPYQFEQAVGSFRYFKDRLLYLDDEPGISPMQMMAKSRRIHSAHGRLDLIVVDYLQMMSGSRKTENRLQEVSSISRELKNIAIRLDVPVLALAQLSRGPEARHPPKPLMSDLRESGTIEQDADVIMFIYRDDYYNKASSEPGTADFIIAKNRNGPTGDKKTSFLKEYVRFENYYDENRDQQRF